MQNKAYNFAFFDENSKAEIRRASLKALSIPGFQVPFASREMPIARGWGTGGLQVTLSLINKKDIIKVIDQGMDESVNAVNIKELIKKTSNIKETNFTDEATIIQSRHRIPDRKLKKDQILVLQVPVPEPLRDIEAKEEKTKKMHADQNYSGAYLRLFEQIVKFGKTATGANHSVMVNDRYLMAPSPIPKFDNPKMHMNDGIIFLSAGREKKIYAISPYCKVESLAFDDYPFEIEKIDGAYCVDCKRDNVFLDILEDKNGKIIYKCNETSECIRYLNDLDKNQENNSRREI